MICPNITRRFFHLVNQWLLGLGILSLGGLLICAVAGFASEASPAEPAVADSELAEDLGSTNFAVRQRAMRTLSEQGDRAIPTAALAAASDDRETSQRGLQILVQIGSQESREARVGVLQELQRLAGEESPSAIRAQQALKDLRQQNLQWLVSKIASFGGTVRDRNELVEVVEAPFNIQIGEGWRGGSVSFKLIAELQDVTKLLIINASVDNGCVESINELATLQTLRIGGTRITDEGIGRLKSLPLLSELSLVSLPIHDDAIRQLPDFPQLEFLNLGGTKITDQGLTHLPTYPRLRGLWLENTPVTDAGLKSVGQLTNLLDLNLGRTQIKGPGLADLQALKSLHKLSLKGSEIAPDALGYLANHPSLASLGLDNTNVTDEQLADLEKLPKLRELWLSKTKITDAGLVHLKKLASLQSLYLHGASALTKEGVRDLKLAIPKCQVLN